MDPHSCLDAVTHIATIGEIAIYSAIAIKCTNSTIIVVVVVTGKKRAVD